MLLDIFEKIIEPAKTRNQSKKGLSTIQVKKQVIHTHSKMGMISLKN